MEKDAIEDGTISSFQHGEIRKHSASPDQKREKIINVWKKCLKPKERFKNI